MCALVVVLLIYAISNAIRTTMSLSEMPNESFVYKMVLIIKLGLIFNAVHVP